MKIHLLGASGSGTTTLGGALAARLGLPHHDTDAFFWEKTDPPFTQIVPVELRRERLSSALSASSGWILSGSLAGWGDFLIPEFDLVVFLVLPQALRMARLEQREYLRYGDRIREGAELHDHHQAFMDWARGYDEGGMDMRSRASHEAWTAALPGRVVRLEGDLSVEEKMARVLAACHKTTTNGAL